MLKQLPKSWQRTCCVLIPHVILFVLSRDDKKGIVNFRFVNPLWANRRFEALKLTTSEEQTVDLLRSKPSICKLETVNLAKWNRRFAFSVFSVWKLPRWESAFYGKRLIIQKFTAWWSAGVPPASQKRFSAIWIVKIMIEVSNVSHYSTYLSPLTSKTEASKLAKVELYEKNVKW